MGSRDEELGESPHTRADSPPLQPRRETRYTAMTSSCYACGRLTYSRCLRCGAFLCEAEAAAEECPAHSCDWLNADG